ncbi:hypothetical protein [Actinoalloteichus hymeniacidonis]|uniref:Uncharacterized protein n=1 Tax=Actinoalloteichus hymeniacidonis TaxID=340345 RepID=A0AAC9HSW9_9PSEU|nr:hypothetical protein [Actinoalloteichus hymeniacidonis]AOS65082.1 hypothetical protein TL08_21475 [Actinoalloteichus hymeniacidonis]MBB5906839.1 hypothetical protein [Actinoalloteichus hymeniacidonis]
MLASVTGWWDGVELWLVQSPFVLQFVMTLVILAPLCWLAAYVIDRGVDQVFAFFARRSPRRSEPDDVREGLDNGTGRTAGGAA